MTASDHRNRRGHSDSGTPRRSLMTCRGRGTANSDTTSTGTPGSNRSTRVRARARTLVDRLEPGVPVDVVSELAVPLPLQVISDLLGVPESEWPRLFRWSEAVIPGATDWPEQERQALSTEMVDYLLAAAADRRLAPADDIISELAAAEIEGERLSDAELAMFLVQLLVAGNETTRNMMSGGLVGFAETPGEWGTLRTRVAGSAPRALAIAVEEMLRWTTPVVSFMRTATRDTILGDQ